MSRAKDLVNKLRRRERSVKEAHAYQYKMDKREEVLQASPRAQSMLRNPQRLMDRSFGYDAVGDKPHLDYKLVATSLTRSGGGLLLTLPTSSPAVAEVSSVTAVADVSGSLGGKYFLLSAPGQDYYVWFNTGASVDPAVAGRTSILVAITTNDTAATVATNIKTALDGIGNWTTSRATAVLTITDSAGGAATDVGAGNSGFTVSTTTQGVTGSGNILQDIGAQVGDTVHILEGQADGRYLEITALVGNGYQVRLDDMPTFTGTENNVAVRFILSGEPKSYY